MNCLLHVCIDVVWRKKKGEGEGEGWQAACSQYHHHHHFIRLASHNGTVSIYQEANVAVIPRGGRYIWHIGKPLTRIIDI